MSDTWDDDCDVDEEDWDNDDGTTPTVSCENCGRDMYEDAVACPECGHFAVGSPPRLGPKPTWYLALGAAGILAVIVVLTGLMAWL
jgi:hypothetical protein